MEKLVEISAENLALLRKKKPLIHYITNFVAANFAANALLATGASPVMACAQEEVEEIVSISDALALNTGVLTREKLSALLTAGLKANERSIPVVLDPVGSGSASFRTVASRKLVDDVDFFAIRGNPSEIVSLVSSEASTKGVETSLPVEAVSHWIKNIAGKLNTTIAVTGETDFVTDGKRIVRVKNGSSMFGRVTGAGCALTGILAAFATVSPDPVIASVTALSYFGVAGEIAEKKCDGPGSFILFFLDALFNLSPELLKNDARIFLEGW